MMQYVIIKYRSHTLNADEPYMPSFLYTEPLKVIKETEDTVVVQHNNNEFYTYSFNKNCIERYL